MHPFINCKACWFVYEVLILGTFQLCVWGDAISSSPIEFNADWGSGSPIWTMSFACTLDLPTDFTPSGQQKGFFIKIFLEKHATSDLTVYYPFDGQSVVVTSRNTQREFIVPTMDKVWVHKGSNRFSFQVKFVNAETVPGNWPDGSCSGPYPLGDTPITSIAQTSPTTSQTTIAAISTTVTVNPDPDPTPSAAAVRRRTTTTSTTTTTTTTRRPTTTTTTPRPTTTTTTTTPRPTTTTTTTTPRPTTTTTTTTAKPTTTTTSTTRKPTTTTTTRKPTTTTTTTTRKPTTTTTTTTTRKPTTTTTTTKRPTTTTTTTKRPTTRRPAVRRRIRPTRSTPKPTTTAMTTSLFRAKTTKERAKAFIDSVENSVHSGAPTIAPWFKAWFNAPTTLSPPFIRTDWWKLWGVPIEKGTTITSCVQGTNCKLPDCFCQGEKIPNNLPLDETPQMIFITIDGSVNPSVYRRYRDIFRTRRNPNRCDARGTVFATASGSYRYFIQRIRSLGAEIAMRGLHEHHFDTADHLEKEIIAQKKSLKRSGIPDVNGWKTPESKALGDDQFKVLAKHNFLYDSTLAMHLPDGGSMNHWPFTLDYGFNGECVIPICPRGKFPGLWEIPNNPVRDYRGMFECSYVDGCMFNPPTTNDTTEFLMKNFLFNYKTNKAPFGIHLRQVWFSHPAYVNNIKGLKNFLDEVQKLNDVYLVSASSIIEWMKNPTPVSEITETVPWNCGRKK